MSTLHACHLEVLVRPVFFLTTTICEHSFFFSGDVVKPALLVGNTKVYFNFFPHCLSIIRSTLVKRYPRSLRVPPPFTELAAAPQLSALQVAGHSSATLARLQAYPNLRRLSLRKLQERAPPGADSTGTTPGESAQAATLKAAVHIPHVFGQLRATSAKKHKNR